MKNRKTIYLSLAVMIGIVVLVNILAKNYFFRLDFTADQRYTLSKATKNIVQELDDPVTVSAYFTKDLPPQIVQIQRDFKDMLTEYANVSKGNLVYEFIDPNEDETIEQEIVQAGIQPRIISVREKDQAVQKKAYLAAIVKYGENQEIIPFIQPGTAMEYALSTAIKKLTVNDKPTIGFVTGHGEVPTQNMQQTMMSLDVMYNFEKVDFTDSTILEKYKTMALINPQDSINEETLAKIDEFLGKGGNILMAFNRVDGNFSQYMGIEKTTGLETWLEEKGVRVENEFVVDASCKNVYVQQRNGFFTINTPVPFPYIPQITNFADHPVTEGLESIGLQFASPITFIGDSSIAFTPLAFTSEKSGKLSVPLRFNIEKQWDESDFPMKKIPVAAAIEGKLVGSNSSKIIVVSDGDFTINGEGQEAREVEADNVNLLVNAIDWLSDDTGLIELRTKGVTNRPLEQIDDAQKSMYKYLNFFVPILLVLFYGIFRIQRKKLIRIKQMDENYI